MDDTKTTPNNQNPQAILKNPWWTKTIPHIIIISELISMFLDKSLFSFLIILLWIWYGNQLQKDKIIASDTMKLLLIFLTIINVPDIVNKTPIIIEMLSALLGAFFIYLKSLGTLKLIAIHTIDMAGKITLTKQYLEKSTWRMIFLDIFEYFLGQC